MFVRTYVAVAVLIAVTFLFLAIVVDSSFETTDQNLFVNAADADARILIAELKETPRESWDEKVLHYRSFGPRVIKDVRAVVPNNWIRYGRFDDVWFSGGTFGDWQIAKAIPESALYLVVEQGDDPATRDDLLELLIPMGGILLALGAGILFLANKIERSIREISMAAANFGDGEFSERLQLPRDKLFRTLAVRLNLLASQIQQRWREQQVIVGAVPHELRSPVAKLRFALDLTRKIDNLGELHTEIERLDGYVESLECVIEDTLSLSRLQLTDVVECENIVLAEFIVSIVQDADEDLWQFVKFEFDGKPDLVLWANRSLLRLAVTNLLTNAVRYAKNTVVVTIDDFALMGIEIRVEDDGPGIASDKVGYLFMPFSRLDESRTAGSGGVGLGLALVSLTMKRHGGEVRYEPSKLGGASFTLQFPNAYEGPDF